MVVYLNEIRIREDPAYSYIGFNRLSAIVELNLVPLIVISLLVHLPCKRIVLKWKNIFIPLVFHKR